LRLRTARPLGHVGEPGPQCLAHHALIVAGPDHVGIGAARLVERVGVDGDVHHQFVLDEGGRTFDDDVGEDDGQKRGGQPDRHQAVQLEPRLGAIPGANARAGGVRGQVEAARTGERDVSHIALGSV
jgi:hypothetical protein